MVLKIVELSETIHQMMKDERSKPQHARLDAIMAGRDPDQAGQGKGMAMGMPMDPAMQGMMGGMSGAMQGMAGHGMMPGNMPGMMPGAMPAMIPGTMSNNMLGNGGASPAQPAIPIGGSPPPFTQTFGSETSNSVRNTAQYAGSVAGSRRGSALGTDQFGLQRTQGGMSDGMTISLFQQLQQMHTDQVRNTEWLQEQFKEHNSRLEDSREWLEQRLNAVERRCEKVERASDRLCAQIQNLDFDELMSNTRKLLQGGGGYGGVGAVSQPPPQYASYQSMHSEEAEQAMEIADAAREARFSGMGQEAIRKFDHKLETITQEVKQLVAHSAETSNAQQLLWKIELSVRQLKNGITSSERMIGNACKVLVGVDDKVGKVEHLLANAPIRRSEVPTSSSSPSAPRSKGRTETIVAGEDTAHVLTDDTLGSSIHASTLTPLRAASRGGGAARAGQESARNFRQTGTPPRPNDSWEHTGR